MVSDIAIVALALSKAPHLLNFMHFGITLKNPAVFVNAASAERQSYPFPIDWLGMEGVERRDAFR